MCAQPLIRAGSIEHQIVQILLQATQDAPDLVRSAQAQIEAADKRYERAKFLYLAGDISREAYEEERKRRESTLGGLRGVTDGAITVPVDEVYQSLVNWDSNLPIERKKLLHAVLEAAFVRQNALVALKPTVTFLPMFGEKRCSCGPDGFRTRDLFAFNKMLGKTPVRCNTSSRVFFSGMRYGTLRLEIYCPAALSNTSLTH